MKRLIAILAVSAMVTTAAFAQFSGTVETRFHMFQGNLSDSDEAHVFGGDVNDVTFQMSATNGDGTLGALARLRNQDFLDGEYLRAFVWWRPVDSIRLFLGVDNDGQFAVDHFLGWGFHQGQNDWMFNHNWGFWGDMFGGTFNRFGLAASFENVVEGLDIHLAFPTGGDDHNAPQVVLQRDLTFDQLLAAWRLRVNYNLSGLGTLSFAFNAPGSGGNMSSQTTWEDAAWIGQMSLSFHMTGLDFGNLLFAASMDIPDSDSNNDAFLRIGAGTTIPGIADLMELRFRVGMHTSTGDNSQPLISTNIMPVLPLGPGSLMFDVGLTMGLNEGANDDTNLGWWLSPVYRLPVPMGSFHIGLHLRGGFAPNSFVSQTDLGAHDNNDLWFRIPMVMTFNF